MHFRVLTMERGISVNRPGNRLWMGVAGWDGAFEETPSDMQAAGPGFDHAPWEGGLSGLGVFANELGARTGGLRILRGGGVLFTKNPRTESSRKNRAGGFGRGWFDDHVVRGFFSTAGRTLGVEGEGSKVASATILSRELELDFRIPDSEELCRVMPVNFLPPGEVRAEVPQPPPANQPPIG
jgi:hypothetical protein